MRAWRRGVCVAVLGLALTLASVPAGAQAEATTELAPWAGLWERVSDLWRSLSSFWAPQAEEAVAAPVEPAGSLQGCTLSCGARGDDIDPNG